MERELCCRTSQKPNNANSDNVKPLNNNISLQTGEEFSPEFLRDHLTSRITPFAKDIDHNTPTNKLNFDTREFHDFSPSNSNTYLHRRKFSHDEIINRATTPSSPSIYSSDSPYYNQRLGFSDLPLYEKMKFLCSYGGKILPRPSDGKLRYVGGETRVISISKTLNFFELVKKTNAICNNHPHTIKYQLPGEDLDALVSVCSDEDLHHMIDEYHDLERSCQRLRLFLVSCGDSSNESPCSLEGRGNNVIIQQRDTDYQYVVAVNGMTTSSRESLDSSPILRRNLSNLKSMHSNAISRDFSNTNKISCSRVSNDRVNYEKTAPKNEEGRVDKSPMNSDEERSSSSQEGAVQQRKIEKYKKIKNKDKRNEATIEEYDASDSDFLERKRNLAKIICSLDSRSSAKDTTKEFPLNYQASPNELDSPFKSQKESNNDHKLYIDDEIMYDYYERSLKDSRHIVPEQEKSRKSNLVRSRSSDSCPKTYVPIVVEDVTGCVPAGVGSHSKAVPHVQDYDDSGSRGEETEAETATPESGYGDVKPDEDDKDASICDAAVIEMEAGMYGLQIIRNADLEDLKELGSGTYGTVYHGKWRGTDVAIKRIKKSCFAGRSSEQDKLTKDFWREAQILSKLHHPNVVAFYGVVPDGPGSTLATVTEYMANGSLRHVLLRKDRGLDWRKKIMLSLDAAFGMEYLHLRNIVHFDLKCDNLLVNLGDPQRPVCKVGDFGLSRIKQNTLVSGGVRGTLPWMAPELLNGSSSRVSEKVDVFSFGIAMWEILAGEEPYANMHCGAIIGGIVNNTLRPPIPQRCDPEWRKLMEECWSHDPEERPSFTEITNRLRVIATKLQQKRYSNRVKK
ncbi:hypothetical protein ABFS82_07G058900 [Erythranthe guttata]|uniref:Protein kinase domain-containing protein n=1 Tax=Erythranthe guttata TaxID=4155 RepID=A0A022RUS0_ERYGU|nr:PREDICTED: serine/threonine-protein kinase EDR1 [Erythranthe guttata]EYU43819.1 hypothetical protein MIMGU_mgv1a001273mg [Erythranthe guttata]|eukprot:XP_012829537.1 PREDICTED: serine/threonine-protein kinase EDR1 [Erythranthe guttata]